MRARSPGHGVFWFTEGIWVRTASAQLGAVRGNPQSAPTDVEFGAFVMTGVNSAPVVTIANQSVCYDAPFDTLLLDTSFKDAEDTAGSSVQWEFTGGKVFFVSTVWKCPTCPPPPQLCLVKCTHTQRIAIIPDPTKIASDSAAKWRGTDSLYFRVKDTDGAWSAQKLVTFTRKTTGCPMPLSLPKTARLREMGGE